MPRRSRAGSISSTTTSPASRRSRRRPLPPPAGCSCACAAPRSTAARAAASRRAADTLRRCGCRSSRPCARTPNTAAASASGRAALPRSTRWQARCCDVGEVLCAAPAVDGGSPALATVAISLNGGRDYGPAGGNLSYEAAPSLTELDPEQGVAVGGSVLTVRGTGLSPSLNLSCAFDGGSGATLTAASAAGGGAVRCPVPSLGEVSALRGRRGRPGGARQLHAGGRRRAASHLDPPHPAAQSRWHPWPRPPAQRSGHALWRVWMTLSRSSK